MRYYRQEAGAAVAKKLIEATAPALEELTKCLYQLSHLGPTAQYEVLSTWRLRGFPLTFWYFERAQHIEVFRLVGKRQDQGDVEV